MRHLRTTKAAGRPAVDSDLMPPAVQGRANALYAISAGGESITCHCCGFTSNNPGDIRQKYCPKCLVFHEDRSLMDRLAEALDKQLPVKSRWPEPRRARTVLSFAE